MEARFFVKQWSQLGCSSVLSMLVIDSMHNIELIKINNLIECVKRTVKNGTEANKGTSYIDDQLHIRRLM
jgi:hypothetical protein